MSDNLEITVSSMNIIHNGNDYILFDNSVKNTSVSAILALTWYLPNYSLNPSLIKAHSPIKIDKLSDNFNTHFDELSSMQKIAFAGQRNRNSFVIAEVTVAHDPNVIAKLMGAFIKVAESSISAANSWAGAAITALLGDGSDLIKPNPLLIARGHKELPRDVPSKNNPSYRLEIPLSVPADIPIYGDPPGDPLGGRVERKDHALNKDDNNGTMIVNVQWDG